MGLWEEFKAFALKGNMIDMAIGIIIGVAFGKVISSLVSDVIMPPLGLLIEGIDFSELSFKMHIPGSSAKPVELKYGVFINQLIDFVVVAAAIFAVIKLMNKLRKPPIPEPEAVKTTECPECRMSIPLDAKKCGHCCSILKSA